MVRYGLLLVLLMGLAANAGPGGLTGAARVVDGDTLEIGGTRVRLQAIDAPEIGQRCSGRDGEDWACGLDARRALQALVARGAVQCEGRARDRYGRLVALCRAGGVDVAAALVRQGAAVAYRRYGSDYVAQERQAAEARLGLWQGRFHVPAAFRSGADRVEPALPTPAGCRIKGNRSRSGRMFHLPSGRDYARVRIDPAKGERWFCSEAEAMAAGWRRART